MHPHGLHFTRIRFLHVIHVIIKKQKHGTHIAILSLATSTAKIQTRRTPSWSPKEVLRVVDARELHDIYNCAKTLSNYCHGHDFFFLDHYPILHIVPKEGLMMPVSILISICHRSNIRSDACSCFDERKDAYQLASRMVK
jgi:hypothetical protein